MPRAKRLCSVRGCTTIIEHGASTCPTHRRDRDRGRGTSARRGYGSKGHKLFREAVLAKHPICQVCFSQPSEHADHHPIDRRTLVRLGHNPNEPRFGRGLCHSCHSRETAKHQPGGWNKHTG